MALFLEGGCKYLKECEEGNHVFQHDLKHRDRFHGYDFQHPTAGYYLDVIPIRN